MTASTPIAGHGGMPVLVRYSLGGRTAYFERWQDNVLATPWQEQWPTTLLKQVRSYTARRSWFTEEDADALAAQLGRISKFQSINSEDALTWSWFGTLACAEPRERQQTIQWLYDRLALDLTASHNVAIDQWIRVIHPNSRQSPNGPELDARIDDPGGALVYVEAKWNAKLGMGKGAALGVYDDQVGLRRDALRVEPSLGNDRREFVVMGISNEVPDLGIYSEIAQDGASRPVRIAWLTWDDLATCQAHPLADEFASYLRWKQNHTNGAAAAT